MTDIYIHLYHHQPLADSSHYIISGWLLCCLFLRQGSTRLWRRLMWKVTLWMGVTTSLGSTCCDSSHICCHILPPGVGYRYCFSVLPFNLEKGGSHGCSLLSGAASYDRRCVWDIEGNGKNDVPAESIAEQAWLKLMLAKTPCENWKLILSYGIIILWYVICLLRQHVLIVHTLRCSLLFWDYDCGVACRWAPWLAAQARQGRTGCQLGNGKHGTKETAQRERERESERQLKYANIPL